MAASERLVVQLTAEEKREVRSRARALGMSVSEYVRKATTGSSDDENATLEELLKRTRNMARESIATIDDTLAFVNASNARIAAMESQAKTAPWVQRSD